MRILDWLLRRRPDATATWPPYQPRPLDFYPVERRFGSLRFGDALAAASSIGRPDRLGGPSLQGRELLYAEAGFQLEFEEGRFVSISFFIGPDPYAPDYPNIRFGQPYLRGWSQEDLRLTPAISPDRLQSHLGRPRSTNADSEDEAILYYERNGVSAEFEFDPEGRLKRANFYLTV